MRTTRADAVMALAFIGILTPACAALAEDPTSAATTAPSATTVPRKPAPASTTASAPARGTPSPADAASQELPATTITTKKLDAARSQLQTDVGSSVYHFGTNDIRALPQGSETPLNQVVLQAPGVVQDSYGQLHVRGDHGNLQYRIDGVIVPEPITGFGQGLDIRFARALNLLTGALPAQYGYRTAGVVDIATQGAAVENGASVTGTAGSNGYGAGSFQVFGSEGGFSAFLEGAQVHTNNGIENPTSSVNPIHDTSNQGRSFGEISRVIGEDSRVSFLFGSSLSHFQIPDNPNQSPTWNLAGSGIVPSSQLNAHQDEANDFQILSLQTSPTDTSDAQIAVFHRSTSVRYLPDPVGDLQYQGIAADILRKLESTGLQADLSAKINATHTLRTGLFFEQERFSAQNNAQVFPVDASGNQASTTPIAIADQARLAGQTFGAYLQDEWQVSDALTINYGARADHTNTVANESQLSPRLGLVYSWSTDTRLHLGYARYFTPPPTETIGTTDIEKFAGTSNALPSNSNTAVLSERSNYFDAGLSHQLNSDWTVDVDAYYRRVHNLQDEGQFGNALVYSAFNYREGRIGGLELSATYRHDALSGYANLAVSKAEGRDIITGQYNFSPDELAYISNHWIHLDHDQTVTASGGLSYKVGPTTYGTDLLFGSGLRRGFANSGREPSYTQVNADISRTFQTEALGHVELRASVINLFDRIYELRDGTGVGVGAPQFGPRRTVQISVTKYF